MKRLIAALRVVAMNKEVAKNYINSLDGKKATNESLQEFVNSQRIEDQNDINDLMYDLEKNHQIFNLEKPKPAPKVDRKTLINEFWESMHEAIENDDLYWLAKYVPDSIVEDLMKTSDHEFLEDEIKESLEEDGSNHELWLNDIMNWIPEEKLEGLAKGYFKRK